MHSRLHVGFGLLGDGKLKCIARHGDAKIREFQAESRRLIVNDLLDRNPLFQLLVQKLQSGNWRAGNEGDDPAVGVCAVVVTPLRARVRIVGVMKQVEV